MELIYSEEGNLKECSPYLFWSHIQTKETAGIMAMPHIHDDIEMIYALKGSFEVFLNGNKHEFGKGDMLLINSREVHTISAISSGQYICVKFAPELIYSAEQNVNEIKYVLPFLLSNSTHEKIIPAEIVKDSCIPSSMQEISEECTNKKYGFELAAKMNICRIFLWILRYWNSNGTNLNLDSSEKHSAYQISKVFTYVAENYASDITVSQMAKLCCMSYSYFSKVFKDVTGQNFSEYVNYVRVREAERLLATTEMNITEIAYRAGFSSSSYFVCKFRELKKMTPKQFRKILE